MDHRNSPSNTLPKTPASGPRCTKRPSDPLKDGSIFHMGSHSFPCRPHSDTRFFYAHPCACCECDSAYPLILGNTQDEARERIRGVEKRAVMISESAMCRWPPSCRISEPAAGMVGHQSSPSTGRAGLALQHGSGPEHLSRSELARQIRADFDSLVRASPLPRVRHLW